MYVYMCTFIGTRAISPHQCFAASVSCVLTEELNPKPQTPIKTETPSQRALNLSQRGLNPEPGSEVQVRRPDRKGLSPSQA